MRYASEVRTVTSWLWLLLELHAAAMARPTPASAARRTRCLCLSTVKVLHVVHVEPALALDDLRVRRHPGLAWHHRERGLEAPGDRLALAGRVAEHQLVMDV